MVYVHVWYACMEWYLIWLCNTIRFYMHCCISNAVLSCAPTRVELPCAGKYTFTKEHIHTHLIIDSTVLHCTHTDIYIFSFIVMHCLYKKDRKTQKNYQIKRKPKFTKNWKYTWTELPTTMPMNKNLFLVSR